MGCAALKNGPAHCLPSPNSQAQFKSPADPISSKPLTICSFCILDCYNLVVIMEESTKLFKSCSLLMAFLFAYSASVQFNDPDWYLWFPLYASACVVNLLLHNIFTTCKTIAKVAFWLGVFLFVKVVIEDYVNELAGFWSLDLEERVVREKIGSGLVVISMLLHLEALAIKSSKGYYVQYGMALLVAFSYGLPFYSLQVSFK